MLSMWAFQFLNFLFSSIGIVKLHGLAFADIKSMLRYLGSIRIVSDLWNPIKNTIAKHSATHTTLFAVVYNCILVTQNHATREFRATWEFDYKNSYGQINSCFHYEMISDVFMNIFKSIGAGTLDNIPMCDVFPINICHKRIGGR